jgi:hypothetical protein
MRRMLKRAQILLAANAGARDEAIATSVGIGLDRLSDQTARARQPGGGAQRTAAPRSEP